MPYRNHWNRKTFFFFCAKEKDFKVWRILPRWIFPLPDLFLCLLFWDYCLPVLPNKIFKCTLKSIFDKDLKVNKLTRMHTSYHLFQTQKRNFHFKRPRYVLFFWIIWTGVNDGLKKFSLSKFLWVKTSACYCYS